MSKKIEPPTGQRRVVEWMLLSHWLPSSPTLSC
jgi:hypothetical protein